VTLKEIRWHGRGGQGVVTVSRLLAQAALLEGKYVQAFPEFGPERAGAPVKGFTRISDEPIDLHSQIYEPDVVVVIDPALTRSVNVTEGIVKKGVFLANLKEAPQKIKEEIDQAGAYIYLVDATRIALDVIGRPFFNTPMLGALVKSTDTVSLNSVIKVVTSRFRGGIAERNVSAMERAYQEVKKIE
jgi:pyruvate ferredoxin oxidoreductase gamma subunit